jgi:hypothetical protein
MNDDISIALAAAFSATLVAGPSPAALADEAPDASAGKPAPQLLAVPDLRALYGADPLRLHMQGRVGKFTITAYPDGRLEGETTGFRPDSRQASGTWRIDEDRARVCYRWNSPRWASKCQRVERLGADTYRYVFDDETRGPEFKVVR